MFNFTPAPHNRVEIHLLKSQAASNMNRDDVGRPKELIYGGKRRLRLSSQSQKAAYRKGDALKAFRTQLAEKGYNVAPLVRTRYVADLIAQELHRLHQARALPNFPVKAIEPLAIKFANKIAKFDEGSAKTQLVATSAAEIEHVIQRLFDFAGPLDASLADEKQLETWFKAAFDKLKKEFGSRSSHGDFSPEIQLFGRFMTADDLFTSVDSALQTMHAFTTHEVPVERDYWSATDDVRLNFDAMLIKPQDPKQIQAAQNAHGGSGMLETRRFGSGVFYHYYCIDLDLLQDNMTRAYPDLEPEKIVEICSGLVGFFLLATIGENPRGYQTSMASNGTADVAAVTVGSKCPVSAAAAFELAVKAEDGYLKPSIDKLSQWLTDKKAQMGGLMNQFLVTGMLDSELTMVQLIDKTVKSADTVLRERAERKKQEAQKG